MGVRQRLIAQAMPVRCRGMRNKSGRPNRDCYALCGAGACALYPCTSPLAGLTCLDATRGPYGRRHVCVAAC